MPELYHDIDKRRIYEVPDDSTYTVDSNGYRLYVPNDLSTASNVIEYTNFDLWSKYVDYHFSQEWTTLVYIKSGGAFVEEVNNTGIFESFSLRFTNDWLFVPANYPHLTRIIGNVRKQFGTESLFDKDRITEKVETEIQLAESSQTLITSNTSIDSGFCEDIIEKLKIINEEITRASLLIPHKEDID